MSKKLSTTRLSKYTRTYGQLVKREQCYEGLRISKSTLDSTFCAVNPKFLAVIIESIGGGAFIAIPLTQTGRLPANQPFVCGHQGPVLDIAWSPQNDNIIASASEDTTVKVWHIPDGGLSENMFKPLVDMRYHKRRVALLQWHPTAKNVLLSAGIDNEMLIWNVFTGQILVHFVTHPDVIYSVCFNAAGNQLVTTCRDRKLRIYNAYTGQVEQTFNGYESIKTARAIYLKNGCIMTTGFSRESGRRFDLRAPADLDMPIFSDTLETAHSALFMFYDSETNLVYMCGRGDSKIRYYEITTEKPYVMNVGVVQMPEALRGIAMMPRRGCSLKAGEVGRFYHLSYAGYCQVVRINMPGKFDPGKLDNSSDQEMGSTPRGSTPRLPGRTQESATEHKSTAEDMQTSYGKRTEYEGRMLKEKLLACEKRAKLERSAMGPHKPAFGMTLLEKKTAYERTVLERNTAYERTVTERRALLERKADNVPRTATVLERKSAYELKPFDESSTVLQRKAAYERAASENVSVMRMPKMVLSDIKRLDSGISSVGMFWHKPIAENKHMAAVKTANARCSMSDCMLEQKLSLIDAMLAEHAQRLSELERKNAEAKSLPKPMETPREIWENLNKLEAKIAQNECILKMLQERDTLRGKM